MAAPSTIRRISGSVPGLLDPTQSDRLLRMPGSRLHFAAFDPLTATARQCVTTGFRKLSIGRDSCRPKRIVVEITPSGDSFWRYVPNALLEEGAEDEGDWPRAVDICGYVQIFLLCQFFQQLHLARLLNVRRTSGTYINSTPFIYVAYEFVHISLVLRGLRTLRPLPKCCNGNALLAPRCVGALHRGRKRMACFQPIAMTKTVAPVMKIWMSK